MPMFEYKCRACGHRFETLVLSASRQPAPCPKCQSRDLEKQFSTFGTGGAKAGAGLSMPMGGG